MFRTKRSKERARARGRMLAAQWISGIGARHERLVKVAHHQEEMAAHLEHARKVVAQWDRATGYKWIQAVEAVSL